MPVNGRDLLEAGAYALLAGIHSRQWDRCTLPEPRKGCKGVLCELGPKKYAMTGADGYELSDRREVSKILKDMVRALWDRIASE
jgi:hypothetical protein